MVAPIAPAVVPTTSEPALDPALTHLPGMDAAEVVRIETGELRRRSLALPIALALIVLAVIGGGIAMLRAPSELVAERGEVKRAVVPVAPPPDAAVREAVVIADAAVTVEVPIDAAPAPAPDHRRTVRHEPPPHHDVVPPPHHEPAAAPPPAETIPAGFGKLTALHKEGSAYLMVMIDGRFFANTPMYNEAIPTGTHTIELVDVTTRKVLARRTVAVHPDEAVAISPTAP
jgi:hypothetical protein